MNKIQSAACIILISLCIFSCGSGEESSVDSAELKNMSFSQIEEQARGTRVGLYMYGGWAHVNKWIDEYVAGELKKRYDITLERIPMNAPVFVNKLITEKSAGKDTGVIDLMWINGENFKNAREADVLYGPFADMLPNYKNYVNPSEVAYDFGYPVEGYEAPYGKAYFVFEFDSATTPNPPRTYAELQSWVREHPGRFTYPQPPDFTGSAFIRQVLYAVSGGQEQYMEGFDQELYEKQSRKLWAYLNDIKPYLKDDGKSYPRDSAALDTMFARGEVVMNMSYHPSHAQSKILEGAFQESVRTFVMQDGAVYNTHYTAIAFNAPNTPGAMVVSNFLLSPEAQLSKYNPANWGDFPAVDLGRLTEEQHRAFAVVDLGAATLSLDELTEFAVPEIPAEYLEILEKDWERFVLNN